MESKDLLYCVVTKGKHTELLVRKVFTSKEEANNYRCADVHLFDNGNVIPLVSHVAALANDYYPFVPKHKR